MLSMVLPGDRPGYRHYRELIGDLVVIGEGRRGPGNIVLGREGDVPDLLSPLAPVIAYGMLETTADRFSITVRDYVGGQLDVEIVSDHGREVPDHFEERRRWTYSTWRPGEPSPSTGNVVREVVIDIGHVLALATTEGRLWLYDGSTGMDHLIPVTNFHNALMLHKRVRDPRVALRPLLLIENLDRYSDGDLRAAFVAYNASKHRVDIALPPPVTERGGLRRLLTKLLSRKP